MMDECPKCGGKSGYYAANYGSYRHQLEGEWGKPRYSEEGVDFEAHHPSRRNKTVVCLDCHKRIPDPHGGL